MSSDEMERVVPLDQLPDFRVEEGSPDIRGWEVVAADGAPVGRVDNLLVDTGSLEVRYLVIRMDRDGPGARVRAPIQGTRLDTAAGRVYLDSLSSAEVLALPVYAGAPEPRGEATVLEDAPGAAAPATVEDEARLTLSEEELVVGRREVAAGEVSVSKRVETERVRETVPTMREDVVIERRPLPPGAGFEPRVEGDVIYVPLVEEELVIEKRLVAREELVIRKQRLTEEQVVEETLRRERAEIRGPDGRVMGDE